jgi:hypothetical protein
MTYIKKFEKELQKKLEGAQDTTFIVGWVSEKALESYRNGITAGGKGANGPIPFPRDSFTRFRDVLGDRCSSAPQCLLD